MNIEAKCGDYVYKTENLDINHVAHLLYVFGLYNEQFDSSKMELDMVGGDIVCKFPKHIDSDSLYMSALSHIQQCDKTYSNAKNIWLKVFDNNVSTEVEHEIYKVTQQTRYLSNDWKEGGIDLYFAFNPKYEQYSDPKSKGTESKMQYISNYLDFGSLAPRGTDSRLVSLTKLDAKEKGKVDMDKVNPFNPHALLIRLTPHYQIHMKEAA